MCGVHGIVSQTLSQPEVRRRLTLMGSAQRHRGPDDSGLSVRPVDDGVVGLGFTRLSIIDLTGGMQPMRCPSDGTEIVCNGEVYNYTELLRDHLAGQPMASHSDIEVALHLYRRYGSRFLDLCNGMYAGAILDPSAGRVLLFRDRFGIKPLYYLSCDSGIYFASEIPALLAGADIRPTLDSSALPQYLTHRFVPGHRTALQGIHRLPPGCMMDIGLRSLRREIQRYWEYRPGSSGQLLDGGEARERFLHILRDAVSIRLRSDVEVAAFVSGGVDSSSVASLAAEAKPDIKLFTIAFEEPQYNELPLVRKLMSSLPERFEEASLSWEVCSRDSLERLPDIVGSIGELMSLGTVLPTDQVCRMAAERVKVVVTGEGADEIFAGYRKFLLAEAARQIRQMGVGASRRLLEEFPELREGAWDWCGPGAETLFAPRELARLLGRDVGSPKLPEATLPRLDSIDQPLDRMLAIECTTRLPDYVVARLDRLSMRHSLEARTPYLDYRLAELAGSLRPEDKVDLSRMMGKAVCRDALLAGGVVDEATGLRPKQPFTIPMAAWLLRGGAPELLREVFEGGMLRDQGLVDPEMALELWDAVRTRGVGPATLVSAADRVFALLCLTLWVDRVLR